MSSLDRTKQKQKALSFLREEVAQIGNPVLKRWCSEIIESKDFQTCTASKHKHQAYEGGLMVHTAEVLEIVCGMAATRCLPLDMDVVTPAVVFHDIGKLHDYVVMPDGSFEYTKHQDMARHLVRSYSIFMSRSDPGLSEEKRLEIAHCILAHHGRMEWGSPVLPKTSEAFAIHCADWLSSQSTKDYWE